MSDNSTSLSKYEIRLSSLLGSIRSGVKPSNVNMWHMSNYEWAGDVPPEYEEETKDFEWAYACLDYKLPKEVNVRMFTMTYPVQTLLNFFNNNSIEIKPIKQIYEKRTLIYSSIDVEWSEEE